MQSMYTLIRYISITLVLLCLTVVGPAYAEQEGMLRFDLALAGYSIGMSYEEAAMVRPFQYADDGQRREDICADSVSTVNGVYVDDIVMDISVYFSGGQVKKVTARFSPVELDGMLARMEAAFGQGEDDSKILVPPSGAEIHQVVYTWDFPAAKVYLVWSSTNTDFATVGLVAKRDDTAAVKDDK